MIPGDIDLTENLDFRHDKPDDNDNYPIIPWSGDHSYTEEVATITINTHGSNIYSVNNGWISSTTTSNQWSSNWYYEDEFFIGTSNTINYTYNGSNLSFSVPNPMVVSNDNITYYWSNSGTSSKISTFTLKYDSSETEKIFGIKSREDIEKEKIISFPLDICPKCGEMKFKGFCCTECDTENKEELGIPWHYVPIDIVEYEYIIEDTDDPAYSYWIGKNINDSPRFQLTRGKLFTNIGYDFPWKQERELEDEEPSRLLPWLELMGNRQYIDYMQDLIEEQDYSSYLTNINWLMLH